MLRATKQWFADNNISTNGQLFTTGYSEGGYAALATQKSIQEDFPSDFTVTASVPASGSYDMSGTGRMLAQAETLVYPVSVAYVIKNIGTIYNNGLVDDAIKSDFTYIFDSYFDGTHDDDEINNLLGNDPKAWLEESFLNSLVDGTNQTFIPALAENDIYDWTPTAPTRLFHGFDDQVVPYQNSVTALDTMISNGATDIDLVNCSSAIPGFTISPSSHANCSLPYFYYTVMYFDGIAQDL